MANDAALPADSIPVKIHFKENFPIETRCLTSEEEYAIVEILKVEYGLDENACNFDITFFISGIKSFSISDDDQECFIRWNLKQHGTDITVSDGILNSGNLEMGERFDEIETIAVNIPSGDYDFEILYD